MIEIDGSYDEGGGSIVRLAVALAAVMGKPCKIFNIRTNRENPGLQAQHINAVKAVTKICDANAEGVKLKSSEISFSPGELKGGNVSLDIGTAGSVTLVLQALMLAAWKAKQETHVIVKGGTNVRWSPTIGYLENVTLPLLSKFGYKAKIFIHKHGFFPKGGGIIEAIFWPSELKLTDEIREQLIERGNLIDLRTESISTKSLETNKVAERMFKTLRKKIFDSIGAQCNGSPDYIESLSDGACLDLYAMYTNSVIGINELGEIKKTAEEVADNVFFNFLGQHKLNAPLDMHAADQILPYLALIVSETGEPCKFKCTKVTRHAETNMWLLKKFLDVDFSVKGNVVEIKKN